MPSSQLRRSLVLQNSPLYHLHDLSLIEDTRAELRLDETLNLSRAKNSLSGTRLQLASPHVSELSSRYYAPLFNSRAFLPAWLFALSSRVELIKSLILFQRLSSCSSFVSLGLLRGKNRSECIYLLVARRASRAIACSYIRTSSRCLGSKFGTGSVPISTFLLGTSSACLVSLLFSLSGSMRPSISSSCSRCLLFLLLFLWASRSLLIGLVIRRASRVLIFREVGQVVSGSCSSFQLLCSLGFCLFFPLHFLLDVVKEGLEFEHVFLVADELWRPSSSVSLVRVVSVVITREKQVLSRLIRGGIFVVEVGLSLRTGRTLSNLLGLLRIILLSQSTDTVILTISKL